MPACSCASVGRAAFTTGAMTACAPASSFWPPRARARSRRCHGSCGALGVVRLAPPLGRVGGGQDLRPVETVIAAAIAIAVAGIASLRDRRGVRLIDEALVFGGLARVDRDGLAQEFLALGDALLLP